MGETKVLSPSKRSQPHYNTQRKININRNEKTRFVSTLQPVYFYHQAHTLNIYYNNSLFELSEIFPENENSDSHTKNVCIFFRDMIGDGGESL